MEYDAIGNVIPINPPPPPPPASPPPEPTPPTSAPPNIPDNVNRPDNITSFDQIPQADRDRAILLEVADKYEKYGIDRANSLIELYGLGYTIDPDLKSDLGMVVVNNKTGLATIVFRGTIPYYPEDVYFDTQLLLDNVGGLDQQRRARELFVAADNKYQLEACLGYSLGGQRCLDFAGGFNVDSVIYNPAYLKDQIWNTSIAGQQETSQQDLGFLGTANPFYFLSQFGSSIGNLAGGGYKNKITVYRTHNDIVSAGTSVINSTTHPNVRIYSIPTREGTWFHEMDNFYNRRH